MTVQLAFKELLGETPLPLLNTLKAKVFSYIPMISSVSVSVHVLLSFHSSSSWAIPLPSVYGLIHVTINHVILHWRNRTGLQSCLTSHKVPQRSIFAVTTHKTFSKTYKLISWGKPNKLVGKIGFEGIHQLVGVRFLLYPLSM